MKFSIITDIHLGNESEYKGVIRKLSRYSIELLQKFVHKMNEEVKPEFVVNLGDMINDVSPDIDVQNLKFVLKELDTLNCPVVNLVGNHEQWTMSVDELESELKQKPLYYSKDQGDYHLLVLFSEDTSVESGVSLIDEEQINWLVNDLKQTEKKTLIFVHHSLADQDLKGNFWFDGKDHRALVSNRKEVRQILEDSGKVIAVFNGHVHWNRMDVHNGIPYFNITSLVENFNNDGIPSNSHAEVEVNDRFIDVDIIGNDSNHYRWTLN